MRRNPILSGLVLLLCAVAGQPPRLSAQGSQSSQILILPNPTPREPDLEKRFAPPAHADPAILAAYQQKRFELVTKASVHLRALAAALQKSSAEAQAPARIRQEAQLAEAMENLAGNVYAAMAATPSAGTSVKKPEPQPAPGPGQAEDLRAVTAQLSALAEALDIEIGRSNADTLAVGVLTRSRAMQQLAQGLKLRLQGEARIR